MAYGLASLFCSILSVTLCGLIIGQDPLVEWLLREEIIFFSVIICLKTTCGEHSAANNWALPGLSFRIQYEHDKKKAFRLELETTAY